MHPEPEKVTELRTLMRKIQTNQEGWFELLKPYGGLYFDSIDFKNYQFILNSKLYGTIKIFIPEGEKEPVVILIRPKEGELKKSPYLIDKTELTITQRFSMALLKGRIIRLLRDDGFLDYASVGYPPNWQQYQIEFNGDLASDIKWACAVDSLAGCYDRNEKGQFLPSKGTGERPLSIKSGHIVIFKGEQSPFF